MNEIWKLGIIIYTIYSEINQINLCDIPAFTDIDKKIINIDRKINLHSTAPFIDQ